MSKRYYGERKIETAEENGENVVITFNDGNLRIPKKLYEVSVSKEPLNPTQLWEKQLTPVAKETLELWSSWDVQLEQLDYLVLQFLKSSVEKSLEIANNKLWGKRKDERRLSDITRVLSSESHE